MSRLGADVEDLVRLATTFEHAAERLADDRAAVGRRIRSAGWDGPDARRFVAEWDGTHVPVLLDVSRSLALAGRELRREAADQRKISEGGGSLPSPVVPGGGARDPGGGDGDHGDGAQGDPEDDGFPGSVDELLAKIANGLKAAGLSQDAIDATVKHLTRLLDLSETGAKVPVLGNLLGIMSIAEGGLSGLDEFLEWTESDDPDDFYGAVDGVANVVLGGLGYVPSPYAQGAVLTWDLLSLANDAAGDGPLSRTIVDNLGYREYRLADLTERFGLGSPSEALHDVALQKRELAEDVGGVVLDGIKNGLRGRFGLG